MDRDVSARRVVSPQVAVGASGAVAVWWDEVIEEADCGDHVASYLIYRTGDGAWEPPREFGDRSCRSGNLAAAVGDRGNVNAAYSTASGLRFTRRVVGRGWTAPRALTTRPSRFGPVLMRTRRGGTLVVAWERDDEKGYEARRRIDGRWGHVLSWAGKGSAEGAWSAAMDHRGNTTLGWIDGEGAISVRLWPRRGPLRPSEVLVGASAPDDRPGSLRVAAGAGGQMVVAYALDTSSGELRLLRTRNGAWQKQPDLPATDGLSGYEIVVEPSGAVDVVWIADRYAPHPGIWSSRLTADQASH